ncbi:MAG: hypothetical protein ACTHMB_22550 [Candidatus Binatia bacterium]
MKPVHSSPKKHKLDFVIDGRVYDATTHDEEKEQTINVAARQIGEVKATFKSQRTFKRNVVAVRANFYREIYDQTAKALGAALK